MHCLNIADKLEAGTYPTKPLETFFLSRHILDEGLFPDADADWIVGVYERVLQLNKGNHHQPLKESMNSCRMAAFVYPSHTV
ncbi:hypothetical protein AK95_01560 [Paenibacillus sp. LC231]|uniref:DUF6138 family protein n=1 Tax=Paenibacillus sp. LC231 TaxID=1120679 RepID=UPI0008DCA20C|nr:hypothetical protein AK95_01560 [Paenibacillus sp. LC231]